MPKTQRIIANFQDPEDKENVIDILSRERIGEVTIVMEVLEEPIEEEKVPEKDIHQPKARKAPPVPVKPAEEKN